ncbi:hypothetical protein [Wolbachia endosymbiont (group A) of Bombylius major]|uniref:hypothetical protein n=1 Tax=Wolbachia endosymbiont (group A) of Bombylius major TaxID=2953988 RepID=UPI0022306300|nr:hypothetical protein [Wolbachia endosymbiont (group A) of Bombylius major]
MTGPQVKSSKSPKLPTQVTNKDEKVFKFEKEEHQLIYRAFLDIFKNPEKLEEQTKQEIEKKKQKLKEEPSNQELQSDLKSLDERLEQLQNGNEKKIFTFISKNHEGIFKNINQEDIKLLSEENFSQLLLSVFKEIREQGLAREEKLNDGKIQQIITKCVADIRGTEAWDWVVDSVKRKIPGRELLEKIPGLGKVLGVKKEEDEPPLSDEEMVTTFLRKIFLPILFSIASISIFGPTTLAVVVAAIGAIFVIKGGIEVLFSNNKKGTLYDPSSQDKDDTEKRAKLNGKILEGIDDILKTPVTGVEKGTSVSEQNSQGNEKSEQQPKPVFEQVTLDQQTGQQR